MKILWKWKKLQTIRNHSFTSKFVHFYYDWIFDINNFKIVYVSFLIGVVIHTRLCVQCKQCASSGILNVTKECVENIKSLRQNLSIMLYFEKFLHYFVMGCLWLLLFRCSINIFSLLFSVSISTHTESGTQTKSNKYLVKLKTNEFRWE